MQRFRHRFPIRLRAMGAGLVLFALFAVAHSVAPNRAEAIPLAGAYQWNSGQDITGTFTSNGSALTAWDMSLFGATFKTGATVTNTATVFVQVNTDTLSITWQGNDPTLDIAGITFIHPTRLGIPGVTNFSAGYSLVVPPTTVPEPTSLMLLALGLGLLACMGYGRRQRRQTGLQIG